MPENAIVIDRPVTQADADQVQQKLQSLYNGLSENEKAILQAILAGAAGQEDVSGYTSVDLTIKATASDTLTGLGGLGSTGPTKTTATIEVGVTIHF